MSMRRTYTYPDQITSRPHTFRFEYVSGLCAVVPSNNPDRFKFSFVLVYGDKTGKKTWVKKKKGYIYSGKTFLKKK